MTELPSMLELEKFILRFVQNAGRKSEVTVPSENAHEYLLLFGLIQRVRRFARAFFRLRVAGFAVEGVAMLRSALEHAVTAQWCYLTEGGIQRLRSAMAKDQADFARAMNTYSMSAMDDWGDVERELLKLIPQGKLTPNFTGEGIMRDLDSNFFIASTYKVFSQVVHVTHQAVLDHISTNDEGYFLRDAPDFEFEHETIYALAATCMMAAWVQARLEANHQEIRFLQDRGVYLSMPWRLDQNIHEKKRRFRFEQD